MKPTLLTASALIGVAALAAAAAPAAGGAGGPTVKPAPRVVYDESYVNGPPPAHPVPFWAFTRDPPESSEFKRLPDDGVPRHIPGSDLAISRTAVLNHHDVADWHPGEHPRPPTVVKYGRDPQPSACGFCHLLNGAGLPENAPLAGLPKSYFIQQVHDFQNRSRRSADMRMASYHGMADVIAPRISEADLKAAAAYYAGLRLKPYLTVVETPTVPRMRSQSYTLVPVAGGAREPIGDRIIETPRDVRRYQLLDSDVGYIVYAPPGSIARGRELVRTGGAGRTLPCATCHGPDLHGLGDVPPIAGRGPSNLGRQLYDIKLGARRAPDVARMVPVVRNLRDADIVDILAYLATLKP